MNEAKKVYVYMYVNWRSHFCLFRCYIDDECTYAYISNKNACL